MKYNSSILKVICYLLCIAIATKANAQNTEHIISMAGIGALKIGMSQSEVEKLLNQKFTLKNALDTAISWQDSASAKYHDGSVLLFFQRHYTANNVYNMFLTGLKTSSSLFITASGIGIGDNKLKIIAAYESDNVMMGPAFEDEAFSTKSKTGYIIRISNYDSDRQIIFYLKNKKVVEIAVKTVFSDEE